MKKKKKLTRAMLRRKNRRFWIIYGCVVAVILIGFAIGSHILLDEAREYQETRNKYTAQKYFELFQNGDYETLYAYETGYRDADPQQYASIAREMTAGGEMTLVLKGGTEDTYNVALDGKRFAELKLKPIEGQTSPKGYWLWELDSVHILSLPTSTFRVKAREDYTVYCDGEPLTNDDKVESGIRMEVAQYLPNGVGAPTECVYEVTRLSGEPQFTCVDHKGRSVSLTEENGQLVAGVNYDEIDDETRTYVSKTAKCFALYTSDDQPFTEMAKYLVKDSEAYNAMRAMESGWFTLHTSHRFANTTVENVQFFGDDDSVMACDVSLTFIIVAVKNNEEKTYDMHNTFYFQRVGEKWLVYKYITI